MLLIFFQVRSALHILPKDTKISLYPPNSYYYLHFIWWPEAGGGNFLLLLPIWEISYPTPCPFLPRPAPAPPRLPTHTLIPCGSLIAGVCFWGGQKSESFSRRGFTHVERDTACPGEYHLCWDSDPSCHSWSRWSFNHHQVSNSGCGSAVILSVAELLGDQRRVNLDTQGGCTWLGGWRWGGGKK